jgi:4-hydroxy-3-polyprenylbenzoate decarboxylase
MKRNIVVAITGASGAPYAVRLLEVLLAAGCDVHLSISAVAQAVLRHDLNLTVDLDNFSPAMLMLDTGPAFRDPKLQSLRNFSGGCGHPGDTPDIGAGQAGKLLYYHHGDQLAPIASGSFMTDGMVVCPCSASTLGAIAHGAGTNVIHRAAAVHLKEGRKLILVPRETPLSLAQLRNMELALESGATILPAMPGFYHGAKRIGDLVDFIVSRICDQLGIANKLISRWGGE